MAIISNIANIGNISSYGDALSTASGIASGIGGWIEKLRSDDENYKDSSAIRDLYLNGFLSQSSIFYKPVYFARAFDEPTYLTFKIEFMFDDHLRNVAFNNMGVFNNSYESAAYSTMYDYLPEPFLESHTKIKSRSLNNNVHTIENVTSADDSSIGTTYCTEQYLDIALGDHGRAYMLHTFKDALRDIQNVFPYYLKSISGLNKLLSVNPSGGIRLKDASIEITCMEGLDLKITQILNLYRKIVWDDVYQRWVLPDMMRYFGMKIYISEIRLFHDMRSSKQSPKDYMYDFTMESVRNATYDPIHGDKQSTFGKFMDALNKGNAISNTYLGTKSWITKATDLATATMQTGTGIYSSFAGALNDIILCNNALNDVMPTICLECHMCEFDINDTMSHLGTLSSSKVKSSPEPKIKIKIGQVKETHAYPLNTSLRHKDDKYLSTVDEHLKSMSKNDFGTNYNDWSTSRDASVNQYTYVGNYISDDALKEKYKSDTFYRLKEYVENLSNIFGTEKAGTILSKRHNGPMLDNISTTTKTLTGSSQELTQMALTSAGMQEATTLIQLIDQYADPNGEFDSEYITGTHSTATSPDKATVDSVKAVGQVLKDMVDKIYNSDELLSMAVSPEMQNKIASNLYENYISTLEEKSADNSALKEVLKQYRIVQNTTEFQSKATEDTNAKNELRNFKFNELN